MGKLNCFFKTWDEKNALFDRIGYKPHKIQEIAHKSTAKYKVLHAGARGGKSIFGAAEAMPIICTPGSRTWIVAPNYVLGEKEWRYIVEFIFNSQLKDVFHKVKHVDNPTQGQMHLSGYWAYEATISAKLGIPFKNPTLFEVLVKSYDQGGKSLLGDEIDCAICSECAFMPREIWDRFLYQRLLSRDGIAIFPTTPNDVSDLVDEFFKRGQDKRDKDVFSIEFPAYENPHWAPNIEEAKEEAKKRLSPEAYEEQILGKKTHYSGRYYKEFDIDKNVGQVSLNSEKIIYRSWDFGYRHPCVAWFQLNVKDQVSWHYTYLGSDLDDLDLVFLGKYLSGQQLYQTLPANVMDRVQKESLLPFIQFNKNLDYVDVCDASGVQQKSSEGSAIKVMRTLGLHPYYRAEKTPSTEREPESINIVREFLKKRQNGDVNLIVDSENTIAIDMFRFLAYEKRQDGMVKHRFKRDGYYEHIADVLKYFALNVLKERYYKHKKVMRPITYA